MDSVAGDPDNACRGGPVRECPGRGFAVSGRRGIGSARALSAEDEAVPMD